MVSRWVNSNEKYFKETAMIGFYGDSTNEFKTSSRWIFVFMKRYNLSQHRTEKLFELSNIFNMDETPVWFDMAGNFTIDNRSEKTIQICGTDGTKFPPICIFKEHLEINNTPTMMVYDSFREHLEESVKTKFRDKGIDLAVIPGGLTSICQPLDVTINKPFKDNLRKEWHIWMAGSGAETTTSGNFRHARLSDICGISTSLDGSDDEITDNEDSDVGGDIDGDGNYE
ncbi:unnamed protein product [Rhizophagus irregularis]|nr:unnamed protein product [Rhizophagus irregularis]